MIAVYEVTSVYAKPLEDFFRKEQIKQYHLAVTVSETRKMKYIIENR